MDETTAYQFVFLAQVMAVVLALGLAVNRILVHVMSADRQQAQRPA